MIGYWRHHVVRLSVRLSVTCAFWLSGSVYRAKSSINQSFICLNTDITEKTPQINSEIVTNRTPRQENLRVMLHAVRSAITATAELLVKNW